MRRDCIYVSPPLALNSPFCYVPKYNNLSKRLLLCLIFQHYEFQCSVCASKANSIHLEEKQIDEASILVNLLFSFHSDVKKGYMALWVLFGIHTTDWFGKNCQLSRSNVHFVGKGSAIMLCHRRHTSSAHKKWCPFFNGYWRNMHGKIIQPFRSNELWVVWCSLVAYNRKSVSYPHTHI